MNPYDELPYRSFPIEWTAPERLALASVLHGGPRPSLDGYRVLELGCADGSNLMPMAYYRPHATFVGVDGAESAIGLGNARRAELGLANLELVHADIVGAAARIEGEFDYILVHGVLSWVPGHVRDALLALCAERLRPGGLVYLNYNTKPGWNVRGLMREFFLAQTAGRGGLKARAELSRELAEKMGSSLGAAGDHPYAKLMEREFRFVSSADISYIAHEFLAGDNHAYWRSEMMGMTRALGLEYVADADFNHLSGHVPEALAGQLAAGDIVPSTIDDTVDLLSYRQMHSPILTRGAWARAPLVDDDVRDLYVASCLAPLPREEGKPRSFRHPSGFEVEAREEPVWTALERLALIWPRGARVGELIADVERFADDLKLLHRHGMIELRLVEADERAPSPDVLNAKERAWGGYFTNPYHVRAPWPPAK